LRQARLSRLGLYFCSSRRRHTRFSRDWSSDVCSADLNGKNCFVAGVNPKKAGESLMDIPIFGSVADAKSATGATASVIDVPPAVIGRAPCRERLQDPGIREWS